MGLISRVSSRTYRGSVEMTGETNYYNVLGVKQSCSESDIKKAYHQQARQLHPDKQSGKTKHEIDSSEEKFKTVKEAYELLIDSKRRCSYDSKLDDISLRKDFERKQAEHRAAQHRDHKL